MKLRLLLWNHFYTLYFSLPLCHWGIVSVCLPFCLFESLINLVDGRPLYNELKGISSNGHSIHNQRVGERMNKEVGKKFSNNTTCQRSATIVKMYNNDQSFSPVLLSFICDLILFRLLFFSHNPTSFLINFFLPLFPLLRCLSSSSFSYQLCSQCSSL